jgi:hypothetical protein
MPISLPLNIVVNVVVQVTPQGAATPTFNQGLIVGSSAVIPSQGSGAGVRAVQYPSLTAMLNAGFIITDPEYLAAELYFGQLVPPTTVWIGRQDLTAIQTATEAAGGSGYAVGDIFSINHAGATGAQGQVTTVSSGSVTSWMLIQQGTGYVVSSANATTAITGGGSGLTVNITALGETPLQAVIACRIAAPSWWGVMVCGASDSDTVAIAGYTQAAQPASMYFFTTSSTSVYNPATGIAGAPGNVFTALQLLEYNRAIGIYSTTQSGAQPNNAYAAAAVMGLAMGLNTGLANSYFTMNFKTLVGVVPELALNANAAELIASLGSYTGAGNGGLNGNIVGYFNNGAYTYFTAGNLPNGQYLDQVLNLDQLAADIQISVFNVLVSQPSVPQTNAGQTLLLNAVNGACERAQNRGFLSPGVWTGPTVLNVGPGTPLPLGYRSQSQSYVLQSASDAAARRAMPIYCTVIESGAVHSVTIGVYVQQ